MNKKGFTLIELLATIIVLAIVVGITIPVTINGVNKAKKKQEDILISNIKSAVTNYNIECSYKHYDYCPGGLGHSFANKEITLKELAIYGFLSFEETDDNGDPIIKNPYNSVNSSVNCNYMSDDECNDVSNCEIWIYTNDGLYGAPPVSFCSATSCSVTDSRCTFLVDGIGEVPE